MSLKFVENMKGERDNISEFFAEQRDIRWGARTLGILEQEVFTYPNYRKWYS